MFYNMTLTHHDGWIRSHSHTKSCIRCTPKRVQEKWIIFININIVADRLVTRLTFLESLATMNKLLFSAFDVTKQVRLDLINIRI